MKRETAPRELRMGCGESLAARVPLASSRTTKVPPVDTVKPLELKKGEGRR
jgi:hypothetical protein